MTDPLILARSLHFAATAVTAGTIGFMVLVANPPALRRRFDRTILLALAIAVVSGAAWLVLVASNILGASIVDVCFHGGAWTVVTDTRFGAVWATRFALVLLIGLLLLWPRARVPQLVIAAIFLALLALAGHAGAAPGIAGNFHLVSDIMHLLAAGAWLGGLPALVLLLAQARSKPEWNDIAVRATRRFSVVGIVSVGALLVSGLINSWNLLGGPRDLLTTEYGRLLSLKVGLFVAMVAIAAVNRSYLTPRLPAPGAMRALQRNSFAEIGLGLCVLLFAGALGRLAPAAHLHAVPTNIPPDAAFVHIHASEAMADVTINPGRAGRADVTIRVWREDFSRFPARDVRLALDPPAATGDTVDRAAEAQPDGTWLVNGVELVNPGTWTVRVIVGSGRGRPIILDGPIVIER